MEDSLMSIYANHLFKPGTKNNSWAHLYEYINDGDRILDVGCSTGHFGEALMHLKHCEVWGVDVNKDDIKEASKRLTSALVLDINDTKTYAKLGLFDVIIFADVLEHLIDPRATLKHVKELLTPKGRLLFSIPHMAHSSVRLDLLQGRFPYKNRGLLDSTHLHFYDLNEVARLFDESSYVIKHTDPVVSQLPYGLIKEKLKGTGISPTKAIEQYFTETNGDIFQIVGYAQPRKGKAAAIHYDMNYVMPQDEIREFVTKLQNENELLKKQLNEVLSGTSWKITKPLRRISSTMKNIKRSGNAKK